MRQVDSQHCHGILTTLHIHIIPVGGLAERGITRDGRSSEVVLRDLAIGKLGTTDSMIGELPKLLGNQGAVSAVDIDYETDISGFDVTQIVGIDDITSGIYEQLGDVESILQAGPVLSGLILSTEGVVQTLILRIENGGGNCSAGYVKRSTSIPPNKKRALFRGSPTSPHCFICTTS